MKLNRISLLAVGATLAGAGLLYAQDGTSKPPPANGPTTSSSGSSGTSTTTATAPKTKLEEMLQQALRNNPDILVAEAKRAGAEAELNRTKLVVMQKVVLFQARFDDAKAKVEYAEKAMKRMQALRTSGGVSAEDFDTAQAALQMAKAEQAKVEAELPLLLGTQTVGSTTDPATQRALEWLRRYSLDLTGDPNAWREGSEVDRAEMLKAWERYVGPSNNPNTKAALEAWMAAVPKPPATGPLAERIKKALDKPVKVSIKGGAKDVLVKLLDMVEGVPSKIVIADNDFANWQAVDLTFKSEVPLGALFQAYQDSVPVGLRFVVRDYGILVADEKHLPHNATLLYDVWKGRRLEGQYGKEARQKTDNTFGPPVEGVVKGIDDKTGEVLISLGSGDGVTLGQTLEVYRLAEGNNQAKYVGKICIRAVGVSESTGEPVSPNKDDAIKKGDRVTSKLP